MDAYFAMTWCPDDDSASMFATTVRNALAADGAHYQIRLDQEGFVFANLGEGCSIPNTLPLTTSSGACCGAIVGTVFSNRPGGIPCQPIVSSGPAAVEELIRSGGKQLVTEYWGNYICFLKRQNDFIVISSPSSVLPCFYAERFGVTFIFSHLERCTFLDWAWLSINYPFLQKLLLYDKIQNGETALNGVRELLGGERLRIVEGKISTDRVWDPQMFARDAWDPPGQIAMESLKEVVHYVVASWANCFKTVSVDLSGGLDSSIVLSCLARHLSGTNLCAVHHILASRDTPEVEYARATAAFLDIALDEVEINQSHALPDIEGHPATARPYRQFLEQGFARALGQKIAQQSDVAFTGQGGDHLFFVSKTALGFVDYLRSRQQKTDVVHQALAASRLSEQSVWSVISGSAPLLFRSDYPSAMVSHIERRYNRFTKCDTAPADAAASVPDWVRKSNGIPPGKFRQLNSLIHLFQVRNPIFQSKSRPTLHPLISQPLIELCLRLPVYSLARNGRNRGLARAAFANDIPDMVRLRMSKGEASQYFMHKLTTNREVILAALMDGELMSGGFIDGCEVAGYFERKTGMTLKETRTLYLCYVIEAWLRTWRSRLSRLRQPHSAP